MESKDGDTENIEKQRDDYANLLNNYFNTFLRNSLIFVPPW
jgi:hypothetical protein